MGRVRYQEGFLEEMVLEAAALVSVNRIAKSLLQYHYYKRTEMEICVCVCLKMESYIYHISS